MTSTLLAFAMAAAGQDPVYAIAERIASAAEAFAADAPKLVGKERLTQQALTAETRGLRLRFGASKQPAEPRIVKRELVSEYGFGYVAGVQGGLRELRQVVSVDGRPVTGPEQARQKLVRELANRDDRARRKMLETFESYGLKGAATDFGQLILLFRRTMLPTYGFAVTGTDTLDGEPVHVVAFQQNHGAQGITIYEGEHVVRQKMSGEIWVRQKDLTPVRIRLIAARELDGAMIADEGTVDYAQSSYNVLVPLRVVHRQSRASQLLTENRFEYSDFRKFSTQSEIKFE